jgi:hypothetical protein
VKRVLGRQLAFSLCPTRLRHGGIALAQRLHFFDPDTGLAIYGEGDTARAADVSLAASPG